MEESKTKEETAPTVQLCASCDRCRARKTKCDGKRPCGNCAAKYMKKHKLTSIEGIDIREFDCVYSPAKRRGPHPGRSAAARRIAGQNRPGDVSVKIQIEQAKKAKTASPPPMSVPRTIATHLHLLDNSDGYGTHLRSRYNMSVNEMFQIPSTPSDEEYCKLLNIPGLVPSMIPGNHLAALSASRFAEVALGALVVNDVNLAMELCNAVVHCLRESIKETVRSPALFEVAKCYFLLGVFRAFRGDMPRYFKYRRVCMTYLSKLEEDDLRISSIIAAISFLDSWAYMIYNADDSKPPNVDDEIPPMEKFSGSGMPLVDVFNTKIDHQSILSDPQNKTWIQGAPPVYLNNEAPLYARALDALSCSVRTCCDHANNRFETLVNNSTCALSPTSTAVMAHENELCSRNLVLSAYTLVQQLKSNKPGSGKAEGLHLYIAAMDAFLENGDETIDGGFTDSQIQSLLSVCNMVVENPMFLYHAGPTYHAVSNAAVMLCHVLNGLHALRKNNSFGPMESALFDEVFDTYTAVRKVLTIHRRKLPAMLRCHALPRPTYDLRSDSFVDLGETGLCKSRGCQGFVLMACSPCVAAERAAQATKAAAEAAAEEAALDDLADDGMDLVSEFNVDDDALLEMIGGLITNA